MADKWEEGGIFYKSKTQEIKTKRLFAQSNLWCTTTSSF